MSKKKTFQKKRTKKKRTKSQKVENILPFELKSLKKQKGRDRKRNMDENGKLLQRTC